MCIHCSHGLSYAIAGHAKAYQCDDYIMDHPVVVCMLRCFFCFIAFFYRYLFLFMHPPKIACGGTMPSHRLIHIYSRCRASCYQVMKPLISLPLKMVECLQNELSRRSQSQQPVTIKHVSHWLSKICFYACITYGTAFSFKQQQTTTVIRWWAEKAGLMQHIRT